MTYDELIARVSDLMTNGDRTVRWRAEEIINAVQKETPWLFDPSPEDKAFFERWARENPDAVAAVGRLAEWAARVEEPTD